jgi:hypothetical protein
MDRSALEGIATFPWVRGAHPSVPSFDDTGGRLPLFITGDEFDRPADGWLWVDGRRIYQVSGRGIRMIRESRPNG